MGLALVLIGLVIALLINWTLGLILIIIGVILLFIPGPFYGYGHWRGRRGPP